MNKITRWVYQTVDGVQNVIKWLPVIWGDRDWEDYYFYKILHFKLKNMEEFFRSDDTHIADAIKVADKIKVARILAERLKEERYLANAMLFFDKKYDSDKIMKIENGFVKWSDDKKMMKAWHWCCKHSDYMEEEDRRYFFDYLNKWLPWWWD